mmetsp:Transcript_12513/g.20070  ORF Transcript_12513/g.20070 Transcript_12513/m.20070 type:complete len:93 (-) Transcript_12513:423-701(-)
MGGWVSAGLRANLFPASAKDERVTDLQSHYALAISKPLRYPPIDLHLCIIRAPRIFLSYLQFTLDQLSDLIAHKAITDNDICRLKEVQGRKR